FREKKLPCDALIYLGTGYCTNGWNTGHGSLAFNTNAFVPENIQALHDLNFKVVFHVNHAPRNLFGASIGEQSSSSLHIRNYAPGCQFAAFCPSFRCHGRTWKLRLPWGWNTGEYGPVENNTNVDRAELHNAEVESIAKKYLELRYRLLPYNYTLAREATDTGL